MYAAPLNIGNTNHMQNKSFKYGQNGSLQNTKDNN